MVNNTFIKSPAVVSNSGITNTIYDLAGRECFTDEFLELADQIRINNSSSQVYIGIKQECELENIGDLIFTSDSPEFNTSELLDN